MFFESFTASAGASHETSRVLAKRRDALVVEPLDLLAALAAESESRAAELLVEFGVEMDRLWARLGPELASVDDDRDLDAEEPDLGERRRLEPLPVSPTLRQVLNEAHGQAADRTAAEKWARSTCSRASCTLGPGCRSARAQPAWSSRPCASG